MFLFPTLLQRQSRLRFFLLPCPQVPIPIAHCFGFTLFSRRFLLFLVAQSLFDCIIFLLKNVQWLPKRSQAVKMVPPFLWSLISHCSPPGFYCRWVTHFTLLIYILFSILLLLLEQAFTTHLHSWKS